MIIIFGSTGMLGSNIAKYFEEFETICLINRDQYDVYKDDIKKLEKLLYPLRSINNNKNKEFNILINCVGLIPQRKVDNVDKYYEINAFFPHRLSYVCNKLGIKMIHITTDCVFSGKKGKYTEWDTKDAKDLYGTTKSLGEPENCTVIRTSILGREKRNNKSLVEWIISQKGKEVRGYTNHYWNGVTCLQLASIIGDIIDRNLFWKGVRHIYTSGSYTKYDIVKLINAKYKLGITLIEHKTGESCDKTLHSLYKVDVDISSLGVQIKNML